MKQYRLAIVEESLIVVEGLSAIFAQSEYDVVYAGGIKSLIERYNIVQPDVLVVGAQSAVRCGNLRGVYPQLQSVGMLLLLTAVCDDELCRRYDGVINLYDSSEQLLRKVAMAVEQSQTNPYSDSHELSERECDVLVLVAKGMANKEIADRLNISIHTVMSHRKNITHKTGIKSVAGLTVYAMLNNLLDPAEVNQ